MTAPCSWLVGQLLSYLVSYLVQLLG